MSTGDSVVQHVAKVQNQALQLLDVGENVFEITIVAKILAGCTTKFNMFQTAWGSVNPQNQILENLQERLSRE